MPGYTATWNPGTSNYSTSSSSSSSSSSSNSNNNNQTGNNSQSGEQTTTKSGGHKLLDQLNKLKAEGKGGTSQAQVLENYLSGVEQKYQSKGKSLYEPGQSTFSPGQTKGPAGADLTDREKIWDLAMMEAGDPFDPENRYVKSFESQEFKKRMGKAGITEDDPRWRSEWTYQFGMPSIVATQGRQYGEPIKTTPGYDEFGQLLGGEYIYSGLGQALMDQYNQPGFDYGQAKETYWSDRAAAESAGQAQPGWGGYGGGGGGAGGGGGYYGPQPGYKPEQMAGFYTPQANLQQAMVNVHGTPTVFKKRGGIVSLLRLS